MVTQVLRDEAQLVWEAAQELKKAVEKLLEQVEIIVPTEHMPVRRALALWEPVGSDWGNKISFELFQKALTQQEKNIDQILGIKVPTSGDLENNAFALQVSRLREGGMSKEDAIGGLSGGFNLDMLAEGMVPGFLKLIEGLMPGDLIPSDLLSQSSPLATFMTAGTPSTSQGTMLAHAAHDTVERVKEMAKLSVGLKSSMQSEVETGPVKVVRYATEYALRRTDEFSPARIWHAWALYPELRSIEKEADALRKEPVSERRGVSYMDGGTRVDAIELTRRRLERARTALREIAVIFSTCMPVTQICCIVAQLANFDGAHALIKRLRTILNTFQGMQALQFDAPNITQYFEVIKSAVVGQIMRDFDERYGEMVERMREDWSGLRDILPPEIEACLPMEYLFDVFMQLLARMRVRFVNQLRKYAGAIQLQDRESSTVRVRIAVNLRFGQIDQLLDAIERELEFASDCELDNQSQNNRLLRLVGQCGDSIHRPHLRGQPIPSGVNPSHPLLNLDPIEVGFFSIEPGIQDDDIPTEELEKLFEACRDPIDIQIGESEILKAMFRRGK